MAEKMNDEYLRVENLHTYFHTPEGVVKSVDGVSFHIDAGETLALVGESGCGKTVTSLSLIRLLADSAEVFADKMTIDRRTIKGLSKEEARKIRGKQISMIFQEPMTSLNPVYRIEKQLGEVFRLHDPKISKREIYERSVAILKRVGVPKPEERLRVYPHQLSGGLRQRVMIAISLASAPRMLIADEPTTALDVTIQAQIIDLLKSLQKDMNMAILLITHDFGVVSQIADRVAVMYAGKIVESGRLEDIFQDPWHVYTKLLIMSIPGIKVTRGGRLESIAGTVPNPLNWPKGCRFAPRCPEALDICFEDEPPEYVCGERRVRCHLKRGSV
ncbi:ABC transporter, ATP-binding protein [Pyramidobacter piscolens W5455]|uniref:ABC transporter, ATP-binding protein n=1 Tax=Pyramidobacter piscolens W5455 TaxID=352165 RepID=A0ABM9ZT78_9BACT|nr:ABC transporter ATP-binding protein [Pyramidobacter piscolens]EFB90071.1 ABC transporter, ATP-binding protein [Pyramidobacter piscolens W5455]